MFTCLKGLICRIYQGQSLVNGLSKKICEGIRRDIAGQDLELRTLFIVVFSFVLAMMFMGIYLIFSSLAIIDCSAMPPQAANVTVDPLNYCRWGG